MNISSRRSSEEGGILGAWYYTGQVGRRRSWWRVVQCPRDSKEGNGEGNPRVLVFYQEDWGSGDPSGWLPNSREFQTV